MGQEVSRDYSSKGRVFSVRGRAYRTLGVIGRGGQATVYRCEDKDGKQYAAKVFDFSRHPYLKAQQNIKNFHKEAAILKYLSGRSRHFIHLLDYEYAPDQNMGYMIMELGSGSLRQRLHGVPLSTSLRNHYWKQLVTILKDLREANVVHADIKPENLILVKDLLKVTDLGVAFKINGPAQSARRGKVLGTIDYMAPEVFSYRTGFKSDIWSAGVILYEMTYGYPPFHSINDRHAKATAIRSTRPISFPPQKDRRLVHCMKRCLQSNALFRPSAHQLDVN